MAITSSASQLLMLVMSNKISEDIDDFVISKTLAQWAAALWIVGIILCKQRDFSNKQISDFRYNDFDSQLTRSEKETECRLVPISFLSEIESL